MLTLKKFEEASEVVKKVTKPTKLVYSEYLSQQTGGKVYLKPENMQYTGAYKLRGAYYKISTLSEEDRAKGLITASAGNHAQGVAYAAKAFDYLYGDGGLLDRILVNDVKKEDWMMLMKAENYDRMKAEGEEAAKTAHEEGVVEGRNANIDIQKKKQAQAKKMPGNIPSAASTRPAKKKDDFLAMLDEKTKSVWD